MSRNASGTYTLPPEYVAEAGATILANQHNSPLEDLQTDANTPRPVTAGGTGAASAETARSNLSVMSVADIQSGYVPKIATMAALAALDTASFKAAVLTQSTRQKLWVWMSGDFSAEEAADIDNTNYIAADGIATSLGCWVAATGNGVALQPISGGGTGAATAADARTNLGLALGTDVQAHSAVLDATTASYTTAEETKLAGIETGADVTDAANVAAAGATMDTDADVSGNAWVLDEDTMASNSAAKVPTQQSVKAYADSLMIPQFVDRASAEAYQPNGADPDYIRFLSEAGLLPGSGGGEWLGRKVAALPAHANYIQIADGTYYERVPAAPMSPASITEVGCSPGGAGFDNTPALAKVIVAARESGFTNWFVPPGAYYFNTEVAELIDFNGFSLLGIGNQKSQFYKNFESSGTNGGILNFRQGQGFRVADMDFVSVAGSQNVSGIGTGCHISVVSGSGYTAGYGYIDRCVLTGDSALVGASTYFPLVIDGTLKNTGPYGARSVFLRDTQLFGGEVGSLKIDGAVHFTWTGGGSFTAGGKSGKVHVINDAGTWGGVLTEDIRLMVEAIDGLNVSNTNGLHVSASRITNTVTGAGTITNSLISAGQITGAVDAALTSGSNRVVSPKHVGNEQTIAFVATGIGTSFGVVNFPVTFASPPKVVAMAQGGAYTVFSNGAPSTTYCYLAADTAGVTATVFATGVLA